MGPERAAAILQQLPVTQHRAQAMIEGLGGITHQSVVVSQFVASHRPAFRGQILQHELPAGDRLGIAALLGRELRIAVAPIVHGAFLFTQNISP